MSLPATKDRSAQALPHDLSAFQTENQLKRLVERLVDAPRDMSSRPYQRSADAVDEILIETDVDGVHYCLVRSRPQAPQPSSLSPREMAIAELVAKGLPNKCIGEILEISPWTVATHLRRIFVKLDVTSRAAMVARLLEENPLATANAAGTKNRDRGA